LRGCSLAEVGSPNSRLGLLGVILGLLVLEASYGLCSQDDAYISFRYARNLVLGNGLTYNVGDPVEGYTNFLWTMLFVPIEFMGWDPGPASAILGYICSVALLMVTWRLSERDWRGPLLVASFPGLGLEAVQGLETVFYAGLVAASLFGGRFWAVFAGLAALTRPEGYAVFGILWLMRRGWRDLVFFLALTVPHLAFRVVYYGDIVPNTFHAKVAVDTTVQGGAVLRGIRYIGEGAWMALPFFLASAGGAAMLLVRRRGLTGVRLESLVLVAFFLTYLVAVGGDYKGTGRFLIPLLAPMSVLARGTFEVLPPVGRATVLAMSLVWAAPHLADMAAFAERFQVMVKERRMLGEFLRDTVPPDRWIAVHSAGILPYYSELPTLDMWGLTDRHIARAEVQGMGAGIAGHERNDYGYVLSRKPELILPENGLYTPEPMGLGDPGVFGPDFLEAYEPVSATVEGGFLNGWRRRK
jgi:arabinofuranosyltransferase